MGEPSLLRKLGCPNSRQSNRLKAFITRPPFQLNVFESRQEPLDRFVDSPRRDWEIVALDALPVIIDYIGASTGHQVSKFGSQDPTICRFKNQRVIDRAELIEYHPTDAML